MLSKDLGSPGLILLAGLLISGCSSLSEPEQPRPGVSQQPTVPTKVVEAGDTSSEETPPSPPTSPRTTLSIAAVGDIMLGTDFPENHLPPENGQYLLSGVSPILQAADITFGNYEGTLLNGGEPAKRCRNPKRCYVFRSPPHFAENLVAAGFDVMSLANNHARDFGDEGRLSSMLALQQVGIEHSGMEGDFASWQVGGLQVGLIAFAPFRGANNPLDIKAAEQTVRAFKAEHDLVMISMHMGAEGEDATRLTFAEEYFHGENRGDVVLFSRSMIEAGADLVIGHGPHVPRALELYQGRLIAYSLGNFCTYYGINVRGRNGLAPILKVTLYDNGEFKSGQIISARQIRPNGPVLDPAHTAAKLIAELTRLDFPESSLEISPDGQISIKALTGQK
ncbi:MAG: CapA family protein [Thioalkalispiraceae bacterium]|jgi:hypothetical protein